jgi:hypothetical protein
MKTLVVVDKSDKSVVCTAFANGKRHDFRLFKESNIRIDPEIIVKTDTGFIGIDKIHANSVLPKKRSKHNPLTKQDKQQNREISSERAANEHGIGFVKRFKILSERYRNRRKRFGLRFNLLAGICNFDRKSI